MTKQTCYLCKNELGLLSVRKYSKRDLIDSHIAVPSGMTDGDRICMTCYLSSKKLPKEEAEKKLDSGKKPIKTPWEEIGGGSMLIFIGTLVAASFWQNARLCGSIFGQLGQAINPDIAANCDLYTAATIGGIIAAIGGFILLVIAATKKYAK